MRPRKDCTGRCRRRQPQESASLHVPWPLRRWSPSRDRRAVQLCRSQRVCKTPAPSLFWP